MPIAINGTGTITGISAGGLPDDCITTADIAGSAVTTAKVNAASITAAKLDGAQTGSAPIYGARAWVNFDSTRNEGDTGASTNGANVKIRASGNVTSVLKNNIGNYTVNFTVAMPDVNYVVASNNHAQSDHILVGGVLTYSTSSVTLYFGDTGKIGTTANTRSDSSNYGIVVFR